MIRLDNTLTRKLEEFKPIKKGFVGIYSCGPTVYWNQHIGHMYAYTQWDVLVRFFRWLGLKVKWVMNITDVGHMTSDEDAGEDKMEKGARREKLTVWQVADKYIGQFLESMDLLNIQRPDVLCRATEHIQEQIELIKLIEKNGFTYKTKTGLVFDTGKFPGYADFARLKLSAQIPGIRVEVDPEKKNPWDFLVWMTNQSKHIMQWNSPWGRGFPGWHIECTAMSIKYLGEKFDIHTGGKEHIPVHHTNEIAQAFGAFGRQTANCWLHNAWLVLKGEKMSKSTGNIITVQDLEKKGYSALAFRLLILGSHYQQGLTFDWQAMRGAESAYWRLVELVRGWQKDQRKTLGTDDPGKIQKFQQDFTAKVANNLNFPEALAVVWQVAKSDLPSQEKLNLILDFDQILGLKLAEKAQVEIRPPVSILELAKQREKYRQEKDWQKADRTRREIEKLGWVIEDTASGAKLKKSTLALEEKLG